MDESVFKDILLKAKEASRSISCLDTALKHKILKDLANLLYLEKDRIISENLKDLTKISKDNPLYDRLLLTPGKIQDIIGAINKIIALPDPVGTILEEKTLPNRLSLKRKTVPLGVVGMIYESRPNVTIDAFSLCLMSGNACVLKGGHEAYNSNHILVELIQKSLVANNISSYVVNLLPPQREASQMLCKARGLIDVLIPRGGKNLIDYVRDNATVPVIETGAGVVHLYFDNSGDLDIGKSVIHNAKTRKLAVCNALDCLLIHEKSLADLPSLLEKLLESKTSILADCKSYEILKEKYPKELLSKAATEDYGKEFLANKLAIITVNDANEAIEHINKYSSGHSEAIIAKDPKIIELFFNLVDAAALYANTSTAFTDGEEFGMGGEIGISTQKLHARGPFSMQHLVSSKWLVSGDGQIRA